MEERISSQTDENLLVSMPQTQGKEANMSELPEVTKDVIQGAKDGNRQAVSILYRTYANAIFRYILMRVNNKMVAEDLTADVFTKMVEGLSGYKITGAPFESWLYRIASSRIVDYRRRQNFRQHSQIEEHTAISEVSPEEQLLKAQQASALQAALGQLNEQDRLVIVLRFVERKSHKEVADLLGKSEVAIRSIQHRALSKLATVMEMESES